MVIKHSLTLAFKNNLTKIKIGSKNILTNNFYGNRSKNDASVNTFKAKKINDRFINIKKNLSLVEHCLKKEVFKIPKKP